MKQYLRRYQTAGTTQADPNAEKKKRMYDNAMEEYQYFMENPASWAEDPEMHTPDGKFNLCLDCIRVDWANPEDIMDAYRLIEEGYSVGTHHNAEAFNNGLKALNLPPPVYNSKPAVRTAAPQKAMGGIHYGTFAPPMFAAGGMPCYECGGMYAEGGATNCPPGTVPDGNGNCVQDLSTPPTPESSFFQYYQDLLSKPGMTEGMARKSIKAKRECKPGDECWEETKTFVKEAMAPNPPADPYAGMERLYMDLSESDYKKVPAALREGTQGNMGMRNRVPYGWRDEDGTVYYEHGVPGTPGYQGKFSGKADKSKYHFVEELQPTKRYGGNSAEYIPFDEYEQYAEGGGIPERYKNMGFTKTGVKKESTNEGKKWMVLAKKGDDYKVVHGGYDGMKDYTQHGSEDRRERFWDRMGGRDSAKANDPFSPLYWHKKFGTWAEGGELDMYDDGGDFYSGPYSNMYQEGDYQVDRVTKRKLENLENNGWNRGLAAATTLTDPRNGAQYLPKGSFLKGMMGLASGVSGTILGAEKLFAKDKHTSTLMNSGTDELGNTQDVLKARYDKANPAKPEPAQKPAGFAPYGITPEFMQQIKNQPVKSNMTPTGGSSMGAMEKFDQPNYEPDFTTQNSTTQQPPATSNQSPANLNIPQSFQNMMQGIQMKRHGGLTKFWPGGPFTGNPLQATFNAQGIGAPGMGNGISGGNYMDFNGVSAEQVRETAPTVGYTPPINPGVQMQKTSESSYTGDDAGFVAGNNAIVGLGYFADWAERRDQRKNLNYDQQLRMAGNTDSMYNAYNPKNPFGNERTNMAVGPNSQLVMGTPLQDFSQVGAKYGGMKKYRRGGTYEVSPEEIMAILAAGGEIEYL